MTLVDAPPQADQIERIAAPQVSAPAETPQSAMNSVQELHWKVRIAFLWLVLAMGMSALMILTIMQPGVISQAMSGKLPTGEEITASVTVMFALFWLVPLTMAFLTLAMMSSISRATNLILGPLAGVIWFTDFFEGTAFGGESLVRAALVIAGLLIGWYAWKWPRAVH